MKLTCISSGSNANCYFLKNSKGEILVLDVGSKLDKLMNNNEFTLFRNIVGVLVTHQHKDHSLAVNDYISAGLDVVGYMNLQPLKKYQFGSYEVIPFPVEHDVKNYGYIITDLATNMKFVYATDCAKIPTIKGIDYWLVECNYCQQLWDEALMKTEPNYRYLGRVAESHMCLETLVDYFTELNEKSKSIILCHLSKNGNADQKIMIEQMQPFSKFVDVASKNKSWNL